MRILSLIAIALLGSGVANAQSFSYSNVDLSYFLSAEVDGAGGNIDGNGFQLRGSLPVYENFFALAEVESLNFDYDIDVMRFMVGAGGHWPLNNKVDLVGRIGFVNLQVDIGSADDDDTGFFIGGRVRGMVTPQFELEGGIDLTRVKAFNVDNDTIFVAEARYHFNPQWSAGAIVQLGSDITTFGVQARLQF